MPFVIFVAPVFSENARRFIDACISIPDIKLGVICQEPEELLSPYVRSHLAGHWKVADVLDPEQLAWAVKSLTDLHGPAHRLIGAYEQLQVPLAVVRDRFGIAGMRPETAENFRDKSRMKELFDAAGIPCARHRLVADEAEAWDFAAAVGYPLVVKPPAGAGAQSTFQVQSDAELRGALDATPPTAAQPVLIEEFVTGHEHSFETITLDGKHLWHSLNHYYPTPLDVLQNPWIQWCLVMPREVDGPPYDDIRDAARRALDVLGMETGLTHLEWFRRKDGSIAISEVAARPPGAQIMTMNSRATDTDFILTWVKLMVFGEFEPPERKYAVGTAFLRGQGMGVIRAVHGLDQVERELGHLIVDVKLPEFGSSPSPSYEGDGYIILRHPETQVVADAVRRLVSLIRVELG